MFRHLVVSRLVFPLSKLKTVEYLYRYQGVSLDIDSVYRFLDKLNSKLKDKVEQISYAHTLKVLQNNISIVFYDMTTIYFEASDEDDLRKTGFSKDGKHQNPQIFLGLLVGLDGYAIGYDIFEGNIYEGHTLIPFIENKYPVTSYRTLIGHSYGGLYAIYILINHPQLFSNYLAIDPSLDWDDQKLLTEAQDRLSSQNYKGKSLFMSLNGQLHMQNPKVTLENVMKDTSDLTLFARSNITFSNMVKQNNKNGLAYEWKFYPRDLHGTISFPSIMDGLIFDFEWYQMENTDKFNSPTTSKEELFSIVNQRAKKLEDYFGYPVPPYPEDLFNALGYMSSDMEQSGKAKMFFEFAIEFYPNSANTYDSMSEYYEIISDYDNALKFATKAYEINHSDYYKQRMETLRKK